MSKMTYTAQRKLDAAKKKAKKTGASFIEVKKPAKVMRAALFLDDERNPRDVTWNKYPDDLTWLVVRNPEEFKAAVKKQLFTTYSFDYTLVTYDPEQTATTGMDLMKFLVDDLIERNVTDEQIPDVFVHSQHPDAPRFMEHFWYSSSMHLGRLTGEDDIKYINTIWSGLSKKIKEREKFQSTRNLR